MGLAMIENAEANLLGCVQNAPSVDVVFTTSCWFCSTNLKTVTVIIC